MDERNLICGYIDTEYEKERNSEHEKAVMVMNWITDKKICSVTQFNKRNSRPYCCY
jgi:hypothetical protein